MKNIYISVLAIRAMGKCDEIGYYRICCQWEDHSCKKFIRDISCSFVGMKDMLQMRIEYVTSLVSLGVIVSPVVLIFGAVISREITAF